MDTLIKEPVSFPAVAVFDFDGTLVQSTQIKIDTYFTITRELVGAEEFLKDLLNSDPGLDRYGVTRRIAETFFPRQDQDRVSEELVRHYTEVCDRLIAIAPEVQGATAILQRLHQSNVMLFVSSATPQTLISDLVQSRDWGVYFQRCYGSPNTKISHLQEIHRLTNCEKDQMLMIGDSWVDYSAACSFGCRFMGVGKAFEASRCHHPCGSNLEELGPSIFGLRPPEGC